MARGRPKRHERRYALPAGLDGEIMRLCGYITSNRAIASYIGCSVDKVRQVRARIPPPVTSAISIDLDGPPIGAAKFESDARASTDALRTTLVAFYRRKADADGTSLETAMLASLYGAAAAERFTMKKETTVAC
ncbi:MAG: hypothetical protein ACTHOJ_01930 [Sphingomonas oligoaromativorans]